MFEVFLVLGEGYIISMVLTQPAFFQSMFLDDKPLCGT